MEWRFGEITPEMTKVDPAHLEFFRSEALEDTVSALVREDIQNRLDAKRKAVPEAVRVRYLLADGGGDALDEPKARKWLTGLERHLNAPKTLQELGTGQIGLSRPMPYLAIECFNTTGLRGDPKATQDPPDEAERNDFYWFIRNVGRTGKRAGDRGRWGLGKIVYPASSGIRAFYSYSVREGDLRPSLIGRAVLAIHQVAGREYQSEGYFGDFTDQRYPGLALPAEGGETIKAFAKCFRLSRTPHDPGLSLVIPFPDETITYESLTTRMIEHYFWEILRGTLEVEIIHGTQETKLTRDTIAGIAMQSRGSPDEIRRIAHRLEFCRKADKMRLAPGVGYFELASPRSYSSAQLADLFPSQDELEKARGLYKGGGLVAFEMRTIVTRTGAAAGNSTSFVVYLQKDDQLASPDETFIRDGLTIIGESHLREPGVRALVLAEDPVMAEFLGDAENPAHTRWLATTKHFRGKYSQGQALLGYVRMSAVRMANLMGQVENEMLENLLDELFGIDTERGGTPSAGGGRRRGTRKPAPGGGPVPPRYLAQEPLYASAGFKVYPAPGATKTPDRISIRMAYETDTGGDPFEGYHFADFDLTNPHGGVVVTMVNCEEVSRGPNSLRVAVKGKSFSVELSGFDRNRDLRTDVRAECEKPTEDDEE
jgi:hypothetical protein